MTGNEISREELSKVIDEWIESGEYRFSNATYYLRKRIDAMPSVQPKEIYNKGYKDGQEATAYHVELCEKENPTIPLSVIEDIKAEIKEKAKEHIKYTDCGRRENGLYEALEIIDKHISDIGGANETDN